LRQGEEPPLSISASSLISKIVSRTLNHPQGSGDFKRRDFGEDARAERKAQLPDRHSRAPRWSGRIPPRDSHPLRQHAGAAEGILGLHRPALGEGPARRQVRWDLYLDRIPRWWSGVDRIHRDEHPGAPRYSIRPAWVQACVCGVEQS
jgi:hypothetical protein